MEGKNKKRKKICRKSIKFFKPRKKTGIFLRVQNEKIEKFFKLKNTVLRSENNKSIIIAEFFEKIGQKIAETIKKFHSVKSFQLFSFKKEPDVLGQLGQRASQKKTVWIKSRKSTASARKIKWLFFRKFLLKEGAAVITILAVLVAVYIQNSPYSQGATYTWFQTDWSGGLDGGIYPNHTSNQSGWTKYNAVDGNISTGTELALSTTTASSTVDFTTEGDYIQEDATNGTDFNGEQVIMHQGYGTTFGDGTDGAVTISSANTVINTYTYITDATVNSGATSFTINSATGFSADDEVLIIQMQDATNAGVYEFVKIASVNGSTFNLSSSLVNSYTSNAFNLTASKVTQVVRVPQYTNLTVNAGASITASAWNGYVGGIVVFRANGTVATNGTGTITVDNLGYRGGAAVLDNASQTGYQGESYLGRGVKTNSVNGSGGSGGQAYSYYAGGAGGGHLTVGGRYESSCSPGGLSVGDANLSRIYFGGAGGSGGNYNGVNGKWSGVGGASGGIIIAYGQNISSLAANSNGQNGTGSGSIGSYRGGGGGGSGGSILINKATFSSITATVNGGAGGAGTGVQAIGGAGSTGRTKTNTASFSYPTSQAYYVTTSNNSQLNTASWAGIGSVNLTQTTPTSTSIKYLVSFDGRTAWKYWNGSSWAASSLANLQTDGMTKTTLEGLSSANWSASGGFVAGTANTIDFAADLSTSDASVTPELDNIQVNYLTYPTVTDNNTSIDFSTEGDYIQEDATSGTDFESGVVKLDSLDIDMMEYSTDALAQAAYVTEGYSSNIITGGTASADSNAGASYVPAKAVDGDTGTRWASAGTAFPHYWEYDLGSSVTKTVTELRVYHYNDATHSCNKNFTLQGSNNYSTWTTVYTGIFADTVSDWQNFTFANNIGYRYYKINISDSWYGGNVYASFYEVEMMDANLQVYSESTIKTQGLYSLKSVAKITASLNKTLTKTFATNKNLTGVSNIKFDIRASRTGLNIKIGIHDTGGTTTEITPNIISVDTFQTVTWDISAVSDANKDAIDSIIVTITNADAENTFYLDNLNVAYPTSQSYYVTTAAASHLDTSTWNHISSVALTQTTPASTSIKYLVSFDNRSTWKYWNGSAWTASNLDNLQTNGMEKTALEAITQSQWEASGGFVPNTTITLDFAADLKTTDDTVTPSLDNIQVNYVPYPPSLISSPYNGGSSSSILGKITWAENLPTDTDVEFQVRTSPDNTTWTNWLGPDGTTATYFTDPTGAENMPAVFTSGANDQYFQYKVYLSTTNPAYAPTLSDVSVFYVVNAPPDFDSTYGTNGVTTSQISDSADPNWGKVKIDYSIRDIDTSSGSFTQGYVTPTFEYTVDGTDYLEVNPTNITFADPPSGGEIIDINTDGKLDNKVEENDYLTYTAYWDAKTQIDNSYSNTFKIRVTIDDNEFANHYAIATGNTTTLDTKNPTVGDHPILIDGSIDENNITLSASDDSTLKMEVNLTNSFASVLTTDYATNSTIVLEANPETVYVKYQDIYGNSTISYSVTTPENPTAMMIQDTSNLLMTPSEYRLFTAWKTIVSPTPGFASYNVYRSASSTGPWTDLQYEITDRTINYYGDNNVGFDEHYYYKIKSIDTDGNVSILSATINGKANGIQDAGEGGGGTSTTPPTISSVVSSGITTTSATITWNTDELSNSTVGYSTAQGVFTNETGNASMVDDSGGVGAHQVVLTGLSPNTTYYCRVKSTDASSNIATDSNGGNGYSFATLPGPAISDVNVVQIDNTQVKINWATNTNSNTYIVYSISSSLSNPTEIGSLSMVGGSNPYQHSYTLTGLTADTTYYFYAKSVDSGGNIAIDNNGRNYYQFTTASDNYAPSLSGIGASLVTDEEAVIQWTTNEPATSQVKYSTTSGGPYTNSIETSLMDRSHYIILSGLDVDETYYYKVVSSDINGNQAISTEYSFETIQDAEYQHDPLSEISDVSDPPSIVTDEKAVITFDTDQPANCTVEYGTQSGNYSEVPVAESDYNENHSIHLSGLILATTYYYQLTCEDNLENVVSSDEYSFTTLSEEEDEKDITAPSISNVKSSSTTGELVIITWETDENANSLVRYGTTTDYGSMAGNDLINIDSGEYIKDHTVTINNLIPSTKYYYTVISTDASGNISESADYSFTTKSPSTLSSIKAVSASLNEAIVTWITDKAMNSIVEYGLTNEYGETKSSDTKVENHEIALSSLKSSNTYHFRVKGKDDNNNLYSSADYTFEPKSPPKISSSKVESVSEHGAKIIITTNIPTDVLITYTDAKNSQNSGSQGKPELAANHTVELKNLDPGTNYNLKIKVRDEEGNETEEESKSFTTSRDENPPQIDQVRTDMALTQLDKVQAIISWVTDEPATTSFIYKEKAQGNEKEIVINENLTLGHTTVITTFKPGTVYYFKAKSVDQNKNEAVSKEFAMLTPRKKENVVQIIINNFQDIFRWARF